MMHFFKLALSIASVHALAESSVKSAQPVAQSLVIECRLRLDDQVEDSPCGPTTIDLRNLETKKNETLTFDGGVFTIPVKADFGRFRLHVQPKRCPKNKDSKMALVGSVTVLTFEHCHK